MTKIVQRDKDSLAAGYSMGFRKIEIASIVAFFTLSAMIMVKLSAYFLSHWVLALIALVAGLLASDFVSGLVHWAGDTWGNADWPIVGPTLIRTFREHHVDQKAITRHDFIETNGSNCMVSLAALALALWIPLNEGSRSRFFLTSFLLSLTLWVFLTNQIHKWAHQDSPIKFVQWLQRGHLILGPEHHAIHHAAPYMKYYCITTGWLNPLLTGIDFFRKSERLITLITGAIPRVDDIGKEAASNSV